MKFIPSLSLPAGFLALAFAASAWTGCTTVNTVERAQPLARPDRVADRRVVTDASLGRKLHVVSVNTALVSGDLLKVEATLENTGSTPRNVSYAWEWVDEAGMAVASPAGGWSSLRLLGKERKTISTVATSPRSVDFILKLQEAK